MPATAVRRPVTVEIEGVTPPVVSACWKCGSTTPPLHPDGVTTTEPAPGIVQDSVVCTQHLVIP